MENTMNIIDIMKVEKLLENNIITTDAEAELVERRAKEFDKLANVNPIFKEEASKLRALLNR